MDSTELIPGLKKGRPEAYSYLVDTYHNRLCVYAHELTNDHDLAEDIVQNVFVNIWRMRLKLKDSFPVKSYLYKSVYNEFLNQGRNKAHMVQLDKKYIDALSEIVEEDNEKTVEKLIRLVRREIENLPPKCKHIFLLSRKEGLSNREIAEHLDVSVKSVEAHITKALSALRKTVGAQVNGILFLLFAGPGDTNAPLPAQAGPCR